MDNFDMAMALIKEAQEEKKRRDQYIKERAACYYDWEKRAEVDRRYTPAPTMSIIKDNLKMARRLLKKEYV